MSYVTRKAAHPTRMHLARATTNGRTAGAAAASRTAGGRCGRLREAADHVQRCGERQDAPAEEECCNSQKPGSDHWNLPLRNPCMEPRNGHHLALDANSGRERVKRRPSSGRTRRCSASSTEGVWRRASSIGTLRLLRPC